MRCPPEWSLAGLHDAVWTVIEPYLGCKHEARVLDVACGPGEFATRLKRAGCYTVACDYKPELFSGECDQLIGCDLNREWVSAITPHGPFDMVIAQEVIEHIESPARFLREVASLLSPGAVCVMTSPNNQDKASRIDYLFHGELPWFQLDSVHGTGHLTPIIVELFCMMAVAAGFELERFCGYGLRKPLKLNWRGRLFEKYLDFKMRGKCLDNVINLWVLRKGDAPEAGMHCLSSPVLAKARQWAQVPCERLPVRDSGYGRSITNGGDSAPPSM